MMDTKAGIMAAEIGDASRIAELITELGYPTTVELMTERLSAILADSGTDWKEVGERLRHAHELAAPARVRAAKRRRDAE